MQSLFSVNVQIEVTRINNEITVVIIDRFPMSRSDQRLHLSEKVVTALGGSTKND